MSSALKVTESLSELVFSRAARFAGGEALRTEGRSLTHEELSGHALRIAGALLDNGASGETIAIVGQRKVASYTGILGILYAGCSYTPINPKYSASRISQTIADAQIRFAVGSRVDMEALGPVLAESGITTVFLPDDDSAGTKWIASTAIAANRRLDRPVSVTPETLAYVLYTSGSTGKPKGVQVTHGNVLAFLRSMDAIYNLEPGFRASQTFDLSFDPSVSDIFFTWTNGGVLCVLPEAEILLPSEYIKRERIAYLNLVPSIGQFMKRMGALTPGAFPDLRYTMFCGEQFPQALADAWREAAPNSTIENLYGPTEATIYISRYDYAPDKSGQAFRNGVIPIGHAFFGHEAALVDDKGARVAAGEVGEIVFKGPQVTNGYLNDQAKTDAVFVRFPWDASSARWYRTADLGVINSHGDMECLGRRDTQVKLGGRRIELGEIEAALRGYPELHDVVVVAVRDENKNVSALVGFATRAITKEEESRVRADATKVLERIFFPKRIVTIPAFPLSVSGKTDRKALERMAAGLLASAPARL